MKLITYTLKDCGEQDLVDTGTTNAMLEIEAMANAMHEDDFPRTVTIVIEKKYTQHELDELPDYNG